MTHRSCVANVAHSLLHSASRWLVANSEEDSGVVSGLRSGIYVIRAPVADIFYVVYWPEATTWNDNANDSIARNRITFMRSA